MNFELSDEQQMLREAAADALSRQDTIEAARSAADGAEPLDLWPVAIDAGWTGLVVAEELGGAGLAYFDAILVAEECGRRIASAGLVGHLPAALLANRAAGAGDDGAASLAAEMAGGSRRAAWVPVAPPIGGSGWSVDGPEGPRLGAFTAREDGAGLSGTAGFVCDAAGADVLVIPAVTASGEILELVVDPGTDGIEITPVRAYDHSRPLAHVRADGAVGTPLAGTEADTRDAFSLVQALLGADALGVAEATREMAIAYAKDRHTFGRPIGSYQAVKHNLVEMLRLAGTARSLSYYVGLAESAKPGEIARATDCLRAAGEQAANYSSRMNIATHGGIGVTWEHPAPFFWRRAQLSRLLAGGEAGALDRIAQSVIDAATASADKPEPVPA